MLSVLLSDGVGFDKVNSITPHRVFVKKKTSNFFFLFVNIIHINRLKDNV